MGIDFVVLVVVVSMVSVLIVVYGVYVMSWCDVCGLNVDDSSIVVFNELVLVYVKNMLVKCVVL